MYVDDILAIYLDPKSILKDIHCMLRFNHYNIEVPERSLGARLQLKTLNYIQCWTITSVYYINYAVANVEEAIKTKQWRLLDRYNTPMMSVYVPELLQNLMPEITNTIKNSSVCWFWNWPSKSWYSVGDIHSLPVSRMSNRRTHASGDTYIFILWRVNLTWDSMWTQVFPKLIMGYSIQSNRISFNTTRMLKNQFPIGLHDHRYHS